MAETILLVGYSTPLGKKMAQLLLAEGSQVISTIPTDEESALQPGEEAEEKLSVVHWNRSSPVSAHNVLLEALQKHQKIDRTLFIFDTTKDNRALHEVSLSEIGRYIDQRFKGMTFLLKELIHYYQKNEELRGSISLVLHAEGSKILPPLDGMGTGAFRSLGNSLFTFYQNEAITINGFESSSSESGEFADFILRTLREKTGAAHGKWFRYSDKGVLNALGISGKR